MASTAHDRAPAQVRYGGATPIATIGGQAITRSALEHWVSVSTQAQVGAPDPPGYTACIEYLRSTGATAQTTEQARGACRRQYDELAKPALSSLIHAQWLIGEAAEEGLKPDGAKLRREFSLSGPHSEGLSRLSDRIRQKLERKIPAVTRAQASGYYEHHRTSFFIPEQRDLYILRIASYADARRAKQEIEGGASFGAIVKRTSLEQPISAHHGLLLGLRPENFGEPALSRAIFNAQLKALGGPVKTSLGSYVFEVVRSTPARRRTRVEAEPEIVTKLHRLRRDRILSPFIAAFREKWTSRTDCLPGYVVKYCKQYRPSKLELREYSKAL